jgi:hypothetical protein
MKGKMMMEEEKHTSGDKNKKSERKQKRKRFVS